MTSRVMRCVAPRRRATVCFAVIYMSTRGLYRPVQSHHQESNKLTHTHDTSHTHTTHLIHTRHMSQATHQSITVTSSSRFDRSFIISSFFADHSNETPLFQLHSSTCTHNKHRLAFSRQYSRASTQPPLQLTTCKRSCRGAGGAPSRRRTYHPRSCNRRT
jgi:hypothetical protein